MLLEILRVKQVPGTKAAWNAAPEAIVAAAEWFFPCLERFVWGISSMAESYVIEGVDFLPAQISQLSAQFRIRAVFLGCSKMSLERFDRFPGRSHGYARLPDEVRLQMAQDIPLWSAFIQQETERFNYPYIDVGSNFSSCLGEAESLLAAG